jgi:RNA polymerase sigma-70 factor, ECF subfamily
VLYGLLPSNRNDWSPYNTVAMSDLEIQFLALRVYRSADKHAFQRLHELHVERIHRFAAFKVGRPEEADEITSEVFFRAWEYMTSQKVDNVTAFLYKVARNIIADHYRKSKRTEPLTPALEATTAAPGSFTHDLEIHEEAEQLLSLMASLKPEHREVLAMRYQDEMSIAEIAEILGKNSNAVRVLLYRAKQAIKRKV